MRSLEKFLFFWGIIVVTAGGIGTLFFSPRPENFIVLILFSPIIAYFWLRVTSPAEVATSKWSLRLIFVIFLLTTFGIFAFSLNKRLELNKEAAKEALVQGETLKKLEEVRQELATLSRVGTSSDEIASDVARIKEELAQLEKSEGSLNPNLLGALENLEDVPMGQVTIAKSTTKEIDVLDKAAFGATAVGKITYGVAYEYFQKETTWYLIELPDGVQGWVNAKDVKEVDQPLP